MEYIFFLNIFPPSKYLFRKFQYIIDLVKRLKRIFKGISFRLDELFFRNLTLILATILIWRGVWNFADKHFLPENFMLSNLISIVVGLLLLFVFDSEVEEEVKKEKRSTRKVF